MRTVRVTVVGDGTVGKTCLLCVFRDGTFPHEYVPTVFDIHVGQIEVDDEEVEMTLWDTAGQEGYERIRPLSYAHTDCIVLCYSVSNWDSFYHVDVKWVPEIRHFLPDVPIILVATKSDLRSTEGSVVSYKEGKDLKEKIQAVKFIECSALRQINMNAVFYEAVRATRNIKTVKKTKGSCCCFIL